MTVNFNPSNKVITPKNTGTLTTKTTTNGSQERTQVSWDQALPGAGTYTGQPIKFNNGQPVKIGAVVCTASAKPKDFKIASNGFLIRSKDYNPVQFEEVQIQENGKTVTKIIANNVEIFGTEGKDKIIVEGDGNSIYGGSETDNFYVKGEGNDIHLDSYNWTLSEDGKKVKTEQINQNASPRTGEVGKDKVFVYGKDNTIVSSDDTRKDIICTYEPGGGLSSNTLDKQANGKDDFYRFNDNYNPDKPIAVVYDAFDGVDSHGNAVRNTLVKGEYEKGYNRDLEVKTFDYDFISNQWKTNFIDGEKFPEAKAKLDEINSREYPEGSRGAFNDGLQALEDCGITVDVINNSTTPYFFKATAEFDENYKYTNKDMAAYIGGAPINDHNLDIYAPHIIEAIDEKLKTETDPAKIDKMKQDKHFLENKGQFYASYQDLSDLINEHRGPNAEKVTITESNIDHYRPELVQILEEDANKPESERRTNWTDVQHIKNVVADNKYPYMNAAGNLRAGVSLATLTDETITISGSEADMNGNRAENTSRVHQSSLVDDHELVYKYKERGTSISTPLHSRRYIEEKAELHKEMQQAQNAYFK